MGRYSTVINQQNFDGNSLCAITGSSLGRSTYTTQRRVLTAAWRHLHEKQGSITPAIINFPLPFRGVYFNLVDALQITTSRMLLTVPQLDSIGDLHLSCKFGLDGSGRYAIFNQTNNINIICVLPT